VGFVENAIFGWAQAELGITNQVVDGVLRKTLEFGVPALTVAIGFAIYYLACDRWGAHTTSKEVASGSNRIFSWLPSWHFGYMPINKAAVIAYQKTQNTGNAGWAGVSHLREGTPIPDMYSKYLADETSIPIFGIRPLLKEFELIDKRTFRDYRVTFHGDVLRHQDHPGNIFERVSIKRKDLDKAIRELNAATSPAEPINQQINEFISTKDAVTLVNDRLFDTSYGEVLRGFQDKNGSEDDNICTAASILTGDIQLYGVQPLSTIRRPINADQYDTEFGRWTDGGSVLRRKDTNKVLYSDLAFKKADLEAFIARQLASERADLESGFNSVDFSSEPTRENAILRLTQLRTEGVVIRNNAANVERAAHLNDWSRRVANWMHQVIETLKAVSEADSEWFATLDTVPPARVQVPIRLTDKADVTMLVATYNQHDFRLVRLETLLKKYGVAA